MILFHFKRSCEQYSYSSTLSPELPCPVWPSLYPESVSRQSAWDRYMTFQRAADTFSPNTLIPRPLGQASWFNLSCRSHPFAMLSTDTGELIPDRSHSPSFFYPLFEMLMWGWINKYLNVIWDLLGYFNFMNRTTNIVLGCSHRAAACHHAADHLYQISAAWRRAIWYKWSAAWRRAAARWLDPYVFFGIFSLFADWYIF